MKSTYLFILASWAVCNLLLCKGQSLAPEDDSDQKTIDDIILQKAESLLLRSFLKKIQGEDEKYEQGWATKRQHPGKRYTEEEENDADEAYLDVIKRQHPGKREEQLHSYAELQKRQHPGKRIVAGLVSDPLLVLSELSKRQHPGKRYLVLHSKRQHPGKRFFSDADSDFDTEGEDLTELEKRQHPGKRFLDNSNPYMGSNPPCDLLDSSGCSGKNRLLLDFLDTINTSRVEEKRQHPGKRFAPEDDLVDAE